MLLTAAEFIRQIISILTVICLIADKFWVYAAILVSVQVGLDAVESEARVAQMYTCQEFHIVIKS